MNTVILVGHVEKQPSLVATEQKTKVLLMRVVSKDQGQETPLSLDCFLANEDQIAALQPFLVPGREVHIVGTLRHAKPKNNQPSDKLYCRIDRVQLGPRIVSNHKEELSDSK